MDLNIYDPANGKNLTADQLAVMETFTLDELKQLAAMFPNKPTTTANIVLKDNSKPGQQAYPRSTWQNLYNLHKMGKTNFVAIGFHNSFNKVAAVQKTAPLQDLTQTEVKSLTGNPGNDQQQKPEEEKVNGGGLPDPGNNEEKVPVPGTTALAETGSEKENNAGPGNEEFPNLEAEAAAAAEKDKTGDKKNETGGKPGNKPGNKTGNKK